MGSASPVFVEPVGVGEKWMEERVTAGGHLTGRGRPAGQGSVKLRSPDVFLKSPKNLCGRY